MCYAFSPGLPSAAVASLYSFFGIVVHRSVWLHKLKGTMLLKDFGPKAVGSYSDSEDNGAG